MSHTGRKESQTDLLFSLNFHNLGRFEDRPSWFGGGSSFNGRIWFNFPWSSFRVASVFTFLRPMMYPENWFKIQSLNLREIQTHGQSENFKLFVEIQTVFKLGLSSFKTVHPFVHGCVMLSGFNLQPLTLWYLNNQFSVVLSCKIKTRLRGGFRLYKIWLSKACEGGPITW